MAFVR